MNYRVILFWSIFFFQLFYLTTFSQHENWSVVDSSKYYYLYDVEGLDSNHIIIIGSNTIPPPNTNFSYFCKLSSDGGNTWETIFEDNLADGDSSGCLNLRSVSYPSENQIYIMDNNGNLIKTTDRGRHWTKKKFKEISTIEKFAMLDNKTGYVKFVSYPEHFYLTKDSWNNITKIELPQTDKYSHKDISILNDGTILSIGNKETIGSVIYRSEDNGKNWEKIEITNKGTVNHLYYQKNNICWTFGAYHSSEITKQLIFKTTNYGNTWEKMMDNDSVFIFNDMDFYDKNHGIFTTFFPYYFRTSDGGETWDKINFNTNDMHMINYFRFRKVAVIDENHQYLIGTPTGIFKLDKETSIIENDINTTQKALSSFPNPFNSITTIQFRTDTPTTATISITNTLGKEIALLASERFYDAGVHQLNFNSIDLPAGIYHCTLKTWGRVETIKLIVLR